MRTSSKGKIGGRKNWKKKKQEKRREGGTDHGPWSQEAGFKSQL